MLQGQTDVSERGLSTGSRVSVIFDSTPPTIVDFYVRRGELDFREFAHSPIDAVLPPSQAIRHRGATLITGVRETVDTRPGTGGCGRSRYTSLPVPAQ